MQSYSSSIRFEFMQGCRGSIGLFVYVFVYFGLCGFSCLSVRRRRFEVDDVKGYVVVYIEYWMGMCVID